MWACLFLVRTKGTFWYPNCWLCRFVPPRDKTNKDQTGRIRVFAVRSMVHVAKDPSFLHADSEDSDQTGRMPRLIWVSLGAQPHCWFCHEAAHLFCFSHLPLPLPCSNREKEAFVKLFGELGEKESIIDVQCRQEKSQPSGPPSSVKASPWMLWQVYAPLHKTCNHIY